MKIVTQDGNVEVVCPDANVMVSKTPESVWEVYVQKHDSGTETVYVSEYDTKEESEFIQAYSKYRLGNVPDEPLVLPDKAFLQSFKQHIDNKLKQKDIKDKLDAADDYIKPGKKS